jgi:hypothetical protein
MLWESSLHYWYEEQNPQVYRGTQTEWQEDLWETLNIDKRGRESHTA